MPRATKCLVEEINARIGSGGRSAIYGRRGTRIRGQTQRSLKPRAIILNSGAVFNKVLHARLPFALLGAIPTTWVSRFLNVDIAALGFHGGARRAPSLVNLTRRLKLPRLVASPHR